MSVCITTSCKFYDTCKRSAANNPEGGDAVSWGTYGSGTASEKGTEVKSCCGENGMYKMYLEDVHVPVRDKNGFINIETQRELH